MSDMHRHKIIVDLLRERPFASVRELQDMLGVSAATVRRDIDRLHEAGEARKVYGGVSVSEASIAHESSARPFNENRGIAVDAKRAIAAKAETLVHDGDAIIVHAGSTCFQLGVRLASRSLSIFTNSIPLTAHLGDYGTCQVTVSGGEFHREPGIIHDLSGTAPAFMASKFFVGAQGIGPGGIMESHPLLSKTVRELAECTNEIIVLADSRKFSIRPRNVVLPLGRIDALVTDEGISEGAARMLEDAGIALHIAHTSAPVSGGLN